jgi:hypothetical protein
MEIVHEARTHGSDVMDVQAPLPCKKCLFPRVTMTVTLTLTPSHQDMSILRTTYAKSSLEKNYLQKDSSLQNRSVFVINPNHAFVEQSRLRLKRRQMDQDQSTGRSSTRNPSSGSLFS